jgi:hypothetical protein
MGHGPASRTGAPATPADVEGPMRVTCSPSPRDGSRISIGRVALVKPGRRWTGAVVLAALAAAPAVSGFAFQAPADPSPASGDARVIAQGVVAVGPGDVVWQVTQGSAAPPANAQPVTARDGFLVAADGAILVERDGGDEQVRLAGGEATLTRAGDEELRAALGSNAAAFAAIELAAVGEESAEATFTSAPFAGDGDRHDLDLVADSLAAGEALTIPAGAGSTLVLLTAGAADVTTDAGEVFPVAAGDAVALDGALTATAGEAGAALVAAVVGPAVPQLGEQATAAPAGTPAAAVAVAPASPAADPAGADDEDADGLTAAQEDELNTDPVLADTDGDGLTDGDEVNVHRTLPLIDDTDGDGVADGDEVAAGTNPAGEGTAAQPATAAEPTAAPDPAAVEEPAVVEEPAAVVEEPVAVEEPAGIPGDSDGDFLPDVDEASIGTDPFDGDTDDDGLLDGSEVFDLALGPLNPDNDGDGVLDGDEVNNGTDPNDPGSF